MTDTSDKQDSPSDTSRVRENEEHQILYHQPLDNYDLIARCFSTTALMYLPASNECLQLNSVLFDSGAAATFVNREVVNAAGLSSRQVPPRIFRLGNDTLERLDQVVNVEIYIAGVRKTFAAFVGEGATVNICLGETGLDAFLTAHYHGFGPTKQSRVTVAQDMTGPRSRRIEVLADSEGSQPSIVRHQNSVSLRQNRFLGGTGVEAELFAKLDTSPRYPYLPVQCPIAVTIGERRGDNFVEGENEDRDIPPVFGETDLKFWKEWNESLRVGML